MAKASHPGDIASIEANVDRLTLGAAPSKRLPESEAPRFRHVLVALDGSEGSSLALEWGIGLAKATKARLSLVSVAPPAARRGASASEWSAIQEVFEEFEEEAAAVVERAKQAVGKAGLACAAKVLEGAPASAIVAAAKDLKADLVVVGSHGHGTLERLARLGSVAETVKHRAPCSVLIARTRFPPTRFVLGTDGSKPSKLAVVAGFRLASDLGTTATVVHAFDVFYGFAHVRPSSPEKRLAAILDPESRSFRDGPYEYRLRVGNASNTLRKVAEKEGAGLIVVGARGLGAVRGHLLGSVSDRVTRDAEVSVLVVKPAA